MWASQRLCTIFYTAPLTFYATAGSIHPIPPAMPSLLELAAVLSSLSRSTVSLSERIKCSVHQCMPANVRYGALCVVLFNNSNYICDPPHPPQHLQLEGVHMRMNAASASHTGNCRFGEQYNNNNSDIICNCYCSKPPGLGLQLYNKR